MQRSRPRIPADLLSILLALSSTHHVEADCVASQFEPLFFDSILAFLERAKLLTQLPRWSILPAFTIEGYIAYEVHHGSITKKILNKFVKTQVLPYCAPSVSELNLGKI